MLFLFHHFIYQCPIKTHHLPFARFKWGQMLFIKNLNIWVNFKPKPRILPYGPSALLLRDFYVFCTTVCNYEQRWSPSMAFFLTWVHFTNKTPSLPPVRTEFKHYYSFLFFNLCPEVSCLIHTLLCWSKYSNLMDIYGVLHRYFIFSCPQICVSFSELVLYASTSFICLVFPSGLVASARQLNYAFISISKVICSCCGRHSPSVRRG